MTCFIPIVDCPCNVLWNYISWSMSPWWVFLFRPFLENISEMLAFTFIDDGIINNVYVTPWPWVSVMIAICCKLTCIDVLWLLDSSEIQIKKHCNNCFFFFYHLWQESEVLDFDCSKPFYVKNLPLRLCTICFHDFCGDRNQNLCDHKVAHGWH